MRLPFIFAVLSYCVLFTYAWVEIDESLVKDLHLHTSLPILSLGNPGSIPIEFLNEFISFISPNVTFQYNETLGGKFAYDEDRLVGFVDSSTGETRIFPDLGALEPATGGTINITRAFSFLRLNQTFPVDHTVVTIIPGGNLVGSLLQRDGGSESIHTRADNTSASQLFISHALVQRNITYGGRSFSVCGPGSMASFGFSANGNVQSLSYLWHPATLTTQLIKPNTTNEIINSIRSQLEPLGQETGGLKVEGVDVCFYDSGVHFMQPVVRFRGTLYKNSDTSINATSVAPTRFQGHLPIGIGSPEGLPPIISSTNQTTPTTSSSTFQNSTDELVARGVLPSIKLGRYVVRDDSQQWVTNANNFWGQLQTSKFAKFIDSQYYWAYPYLFTSSKNAFINSVNVAEVEVHGNWDPFSTEKNCCDLVHLSDIPTDGYGGGANGSLAYWVIHSCEVIPTPADFSAADFHKAFDPWFRLFNGMHAAVGYRTEMFIADGVMPTFGRLISLGGAFVSSWLQAVHVDSAYNGRPTYFDNNRDITEPLGRASAVVVCGHESDRVWQIANIGRPGCLREFWYDN